MRIEPKKIMCAIDFSDFTDLTLSYGRAMALEFDAKLCLCHIVSNMVLVSSAGQAYIASDKIEQERRQDARSRLETLAGDLEIECEIIVSTGHPANDLGEIALKNDIDFVIAATHGGSGFKRFLIGSVTDRLVKTLACPLLVLHENKDHPVLPGDRDIFLKRILVGCDFSPDSRLAFDYGLSLAQEFQAELYLAHVIRPSERIEFSSADYIKVQEGDYIDLQQKDGLASRLEKQLADMVPEECRNWCTPITTLLRGEPYAELIKLAELKHIDMIVLGIHGHSLLEKFLVGSTTDRVISRATCSVLAVRQT